MIYGDTSGNVDILYNGVIFELNLNDHDPRKYNDEINDFVKKITPSFEKFKNVETTMNDLLLVNGTWICKTCHCVNLRKSPETSPELKKMLKWYLNSQYGKIG